MSEVPLVKDFTTFWKRPATACLFSLATKTIKSFRRPSDLINRGGAFEVKDYLDLKAKFELMDMPESFLLACEVTKSYVLENLGATDKIMRLL